MFRERDWILRVVKEVAELIARALKLVDENKGEQAIEVLQAACASALGIEYRTLSFLDSRSAVDLLNEGPKVVGFAQLLEAMGEVELKSGDPLKAEVRFRHALEIVGALLAKKPGHAGATEVAARLEERLKS